MRAYASIYRPFRPTAISGHTRHTSGHTRLISGHEKAETYHAITGRHESMSDIPCPAWQETEVAWMFEFYFYPPDQLPTLLLVALTGIVAATAVAIAFGNVFTNCTSI